MTRFGLTEKEGDVIPDPGEPIYTFYCACAEYTDDPGSVVCWRCEQTIVDVENLRGLNKTMVQNLLGLTIRYRAALEAIESDSRRAELANVDDYLRGVAVGALEVSGLTERNAG